jgi:hypothetical protein
VAEAAFTILAMFPACLFGLLEKNSPT